MTTSIKTARIPMPNTQTSNPSNQKIVLIPFLTTNQLIIRTILLILRTQINLMIYTLTIFSRVNFKNFV